MTVCFVTIGMVIFSRIGFNTFVGQVRATGVTAFTGATLDGVPLPLAGSAGRSISDVGVPHQLVVTGTCNPGQPVTAALNEIDKGIDDSDPSTNDDRLDRESPAPTGNCPANGQFTLTFDIWCEEGSFLWWTYRHLNGPSGSCGEENPDSLYVVDGNNGATRIPKDTPAGVKPDRRNGNQWIITCDKSKSFDLPPPSTDKIIESFGTRLHIPAGAFDQNITMTIKNPTVIPSRYSIPPDMSPMRVAYEIQTEPQISFAVPISVEMYFSDGEAEGVIPSTMEAFSYNNTLSAWKTIQSTVNATHHDVHFNITAPGIYGITGQSTDVGGILIPVDKLALLAPYIALGVAVVAVTIGVTYARKRWFKKAVVQRP